MHLSDGQSRIRPVLLFLGLDEFTCKTMLPVERLRQVNPNFIHAIATYCISTLECQHLTFVDRSYGTLTIYRTGTPQLAWNVARTHRISTPIFWTSGADSRPQRKRTQNFTYTSQTNHYFLHVMVHRCRKVSTPATGKGRRHLT